MFVIAGDFFLLQAGKPVTTKTVVMSDGSGGTAHGNRQIDFLSSVLTQANIDLESYQYVEDGQIALSSRCIIPQAKPN